MLNKSLFTLAAVALLSFTVSAGADVIAVYNFNNSVNGATGADDVVDLTPSGQATVLTVGNIVSSAPFVATDTDDGPVNPTASSNGSGAGERPYIHNGTLDGQPKEIDDSFAYNVPGRTTRFTTQNLSFLVTVPGDTDVDLTNLTLRMRMSQNNGAGSNGPDTYSVRVNDVQIGSTQVHNGTNVITLDFDLTSVATLTSDFTVGLYFTGGGGTDRSAIMDDITLNGDVIGEVIPEPASAGLLALGALGLLARRRRA